MKIVLTGGIACGKSALAKFLAELGFRVLDADDVVHELESANGAAVAPIRKRFGEGVVAPDGSIDRKALAAAVFAHPSARRDLEAILHPMVRRRLLDFLDDEREGKQSDKIVSVPLLFESHWEGDYDIILSVVSPLHLQLERMMSTRGYSGEQAQARLAAQISAAGKAARSDYVVVNDSTVEHLGLEAKRLAAWLNERTKNE